MKIPLFISVIIPIYNQKEVFSNNLTAWQEQSYSKDLYEIIIVNDGSLDGLESFIVSVVKESVVSIRYFHQLHQGPAAARNLGMRHAKGAIVAFSDADCRPFQDWVNEIVRGYTDDIIAGIGGTTQAGVTGSIVSQYCAYVRMNEVPDRKNGEITYLITANASFRKDYLLAIGGFDERYAWAGGEDPELCYRLRQKGYFFKHNRKAIVVNSHKGSVSALAKTFFFYGMGAAFLGLSKFSQWDFYSVRGIRFVYCCVKAWILCMILFFKTFKSFLRFPFRVIWYYGEGVCWWRAFIYAFLESIQSLSFQYGCIAGYISGKFKGIKRPILNEVISESI